MRLTAQLRSSHFLNAARHLARSRAGGVAVANAAKNAREAPTHHSPTNSFQKNYKVLASHHTEKGS